MIVGHGRSGRGVIGGAAPAAAEAMRKAFADHRGTYEFTKRFDEACKAVGFPTGHWPPLVRDLTPTQHALVQLVADEKFGAPSHIPTTVAARRRWLGLDPPALLEQVVRLPDGEEVPLWLALHKLPRRAEEPSRNSLMRTFPVETRLRILAEVGEDWTNAYSVDPYDVFASNAENLAQIQGQGADWLPAFADRLASRAGDKEHYRMPVFLALVRANIPIKPEWDGLLPVSPWLELEPFMIEAARAIPDDRREAALVGALEHSLYKVGIASVLYDAFPLPALLEIVKKWLPYASNAAEKKRGKEALAKGGVATKPAKAVVVTCTRAFKPNTLSDLSKSQQAQLVKAGKRWDGANVPAEKRLSNDKQDEQNLAGTLEVRELADAKGKHAYDAFTYAGDSGTIFKAGTTTVVAEIVQGSMESKNEALGDALEAALVATPAPASKNAPKKKPAAKKPAKRK